MKAFAFSTLYAAIATVILLIATPFVPTSLMVQLQDLTMRDDSLVLTRSVLVPQTGHFDVEVLSGVRKIPQCTMSESAFLEDRGNTPLVVPMQCKLPRGEYNVRVCITVSFLGIDMKPECLEALWQVGGPIPLSERVNRIKRLVESLERQVEIYEGIIK